jgi:Metallo-beta-lactamase superfamily.
VLLLRLTIIGCWGGYPKVDEASSGYLVEQDGFTLLLDCGSGVLAKLPRFLEPSSLHAVLISHYHADHIADIGVLQHALLIRQALGGKKGTLPIYGHSLDPGEFLRLSYREITKGIEYHPERPLPVGPFTIRFLRTDHPVPCFAFRIESKGKSIVYTADGAFQQGLIAFADDADLLLCECNFYADMDGRQAGHMNSREAGILARESRVKQLVLTHLPHFGNPDRLVAEAKQNYSGPVTLAALGRRFDL